MSSGAATTTAVEKKTAQENQRRNRSARQLATAITTRKVCAWTSGSSPAMAPAAIMRRILDWFTWYDEGLVFIAGSAAAAGESETNAISAVFSAESSSFWKAKHH